MLFLAQISLARAIVGRISVNDDMSKALNHVLAQADELHDAFFRQNDQEIQTSLRNLVNSIEHARRTTKSEKLNGFHLNRVLETAYFHFKSLLKGGGGDDRTKGLRLGYEQIVLLAQTYKLDSYKIFYCGKSDTIWLQKNYKAQNPFHPSTMGDCGVQVRQ
ncbi:MAG: hypothetical protein A4S09_12950 [Proteobacteria bacterium SG_bin7]|nr:MAG: hypothetical protein A4S09_12950 [Proteobacteria bacterium SG_bin7]